jgi:DNA replication and repair protein RecF
MVESGAEIATQRARFLDALKTSLLPILQGIFPKEPGLHLYPGWPGCDPMANLLEAAWNEDLETGHTVRGPHAADVKISIENRSLSSVFSRGQIKLFVSLMMIAQARVFSEKTGVSPIILLDDYRAELDENACEHLLTALHEAGAQTFLTTSETDLGRPALQNLRVFHVEHGKIT